MSKEDIKLSIEHVKKTVDTILKIVNQNSLAHLMLSQASDELEALLKEEFTEDN